MKARYYREDNFWFRSWALQNEVSDLLSLVCVFGLQHKFTTVFESKSVENARIDRLFLTVCKVGDPNVARLLIDRGADVSAANKYGSTPLHRASEAGHEAVARLLVDRGADVSAADEDGSTPLHRALQRGHEAVARVPQGAIQLTAATAPRQQRKYESLLAPSSSSSTHIPAHSPIPSSYGDATPRRSVGWVQISRSS